jgi:hypothetical protein
MVINGKRTRLKPGDGIHFENESGDEFARLTIRRGPYTHGEPMRDRDKPDGIGIELEAVTTSVPPITDASFKDEFALMTYSDGGATAAGIRYMGIWPLVKVTRTIQENG